MRQLEHAEPPGRGDVRTAAEVDELPLSIAGDALAGKLPRDLDLQRIVLPLEDRDRFGNRHLATLDLPVFADDLPHLGLDLPEVFGSERPRGQEVVVVPVLDRRPDSDLDLGKEPPDRLGGQVRRRVAVNRHGVGRLPRHDLERPVGLEGRDEIDDRAVELAGDRVFRQTRTDPLRDLADRRAFGDLEGAPVGQPDRHFLRQRFHVLPISESFRRPGP